MIVSDTSPLIFLGKIGKLHLLKDLFEEVRVPSSVQEEIQVKEESVEATALKKGSEEGWIKVENVDASDLLESASVEEAEKEAITLADKEESMALLDNDQARAYADIMGVEAHGTLYVLMKGKAQGLLDREEAMGALEDMMKEGFYISTEVYKTFQEFIQ